MDLPWFCCCSQVEMLVTNRCLVPGMSRMFWLMCFKFVYFWVEHGCLYCDNINEFEWMFLSSTAASVYFIKLFPKTNPSQHNWTTSKSNLMCLVTMRSKYLKFHYYKIVYINCYNRFDTSQAFFLQLLLIWPEPCDSGNKADEPADFQNRHTTQNNPQIFVLFLCFICSNRKNTHL